MILRTLSILRKVVLVGLTVAAVGTGGLWGLSHVLVGEVFEGGYIWDTGISWGGALRNESLFCAVTEGRLLIIPAARWDYDRQEYTRGVSWDWATRSRTVVDPRGEDWTRGVQMPMCYLFAVFAAYPAIAFIRGPLRRWRRRKRGLCITCGYDLTGNESGVCPECGVVVPRQD